MSNTEQFRDWRASVDHHLERIYCITIEDAGFDDEYLLRHWQSDEAPLDFVQWFGNKYDLTPKELVIQARAR